jgi:integration host factor subunit beta
VVNSHFANVLTGGTGAGGRKASHGTFVRRAAIRNARTSICEHGETKEMTKADLIEEVSRVAELTRKDSEVIVETIFDSVVRTLRAGDKIEIRGFGSFRTRQRKPRVGRNPKTGDRVEVPPKTIPFFKPSKELKDMVNRDASAAQAVAADPATTDPAASQPES